LERLHGNRLRDHAPDGRRLRRRSRYADVVHDDEHVDDADDGYVDFEHGYVDHDHGYVDHDHGYVDDDDYLAAPGAPPR
jgi:hypothetical protein